MDVWLLWEARDNQDTVQEKDLCYSHCLDILQQIIFRVSDQPSPLIQALSSDFVQRRCNDLTAASRVLSQQKHGKHCLENVFSLFNVVERGMWHTPKLNVWTLNRKLFKKLSKIILLYGNACKLCYSSKLNYLTQRLIIVCSTAWEPTEHNPVGRNRTWVFKFKKAFQ